MKSYTFFKHRSILNTLYGQQVYNSTYNALLWHIITYFVILHTCRIGLTVDFVYFKIDSHQKPGIRWVFPFNM